MMKIKFEYVKKYSDFETHKVEFYDYYDLLKFLQKTRKITNDLHLHDWELRELSQKKLKKLIMDNFTKEYFFDITEINVKEEV